MPCRPPTGWCAVQTPARETGQGLPRDRCGLPGQSRAPRAWRRVAGRAGLGAEQSRHGWSETNEGLSRCSAGSPAETAGPVRVCVADAGGCSRGGRIEPAGVCVFILQRRCMLSLRLSAAASTAWAGFWHMGCPGCRWSDATGTF